MKARIKFTKSGNMKFIGHLDIMRFFQKAVRRAGIDIAYTKGFSPHQIMSFAAPLGVGKTSLGEYMDIELNSVSTSKEMLEALNAQMVPGIEVVSIKALGQNAKNSMSIVAAADYEVSIREDYKENFKLSKLNDFYHLNEITVLKATKKSEKQVDIKPMIYRLGELGGNVLMTLATGSVINLKPELVMEAFYRYQNPHKIMPEFALQIKRLEIYANIGKEGDLDLVSLDSLGEDI